MVTYYMVRTAAENAQNTRNTLDRLLEEHNNEGSGPIYYRREYHTTTEEDPSALLFEFELLINGRAPTVNTFLESGRFQIRRQLEDPKVTYVMEQYDGLWNSSPTKLREAMEQEIGKKPISIDFVTPGRMAAWGLQGSIEDLTRFTYHLLHRGYSLQEVRCEEQEYMPLTEADILEEVHELDEGDLIYAQREGFPSEGTVVAPTYSITDSMIVDVREQVAPIKTPKSGLHIVKGTIENSADWKEDLAALRKRLLTPPGKK